MMSHIDCWATLATMVGLTPPPHGAWMGNDGKPIYFDSIDNSAYILGKAKHSARNSWVYIDGENFVGVRADIGGDPKNPDVNIAWKYLYTAKDSWLGPKQTSAPSARSTTLPWILIEKYDMTFNGAVAARVPHPRRASMRARTMAGRWRCCISGVIEFDKSIVEFPNIERIPGGASSDQVPNLRESEKPGADMDLKKPLQSIPGAGG